VDVKFLSKDQVEFVITSHPWFSGLDYVGEIDLINSPLLAIFSSAKCSAGQILKAHDYAKNIRNGKMGVISGFHAPAEKEVLEVLLKGACPIIVVLGRRLEGARIPAAWKTEIERGRMLVISPFKEYQKYVTKEISLKRNDLAAQVAGRVLIVHASEGGSLQGQIEKWKLVGIDVKHLS
jgi:predicted Rossmann fold nucleotide-binding protein DprA/Smf involved in DNA uptake